MATPDLHLLSSYDFDLPEELIAQQPVEPRDSSRLMVIHRATGRVEHRHFRDLTEYLDAQDLLIANNTKVMHARLLGARLNPDGTQGGKIEFLLLEKRGEQEGQPIWEGLFRSTARQVRGLRFVIPSLQGPGLIGTIIRGAAESPLGTVEAIFESDPLKVGTGELPLPPYIQRKPGASDDSRYQTTYADSEREGSAAAPTAGLHFTESLLEKLRLKGTGWETVTLNVGLGTFRPVKTEDVRAHAMHEEVYEVPLRTAQAIQDARKNGRRILAVGTTSVRTLESAWDPEQGVRAGRGRSQLFLRPGGAEFHVVDRLITNFHLPKSTLLMLVAQFIGYELMREAYRVAVKEHYRFFSYGDAMLVL